MIDLRRVDQLLRRREADINKEWDSTLTVGKLRENAETAPRVLVAIRGTDCIESPVQVHFAVLIANVVVAQIHGPCNGNKRHRHDLHSVQVASTSVSRISSG